MKIGKMVNRFLRMINDNGMNLKRKKPGNHFRKQDKNPIDALK